MSMRVLIATNNTWLCTTVKAELRKHGHAVDCSNTESDTFFKTQYTKYQLIIIDMSLPPSDGWETLGTLRYKGYNCPIMVINNPNKRDELIRSFDDGADDYMTFPIDFEEFAARSKALLRRHQMLTVETVECHGIRVNLVKGTVSKDDRNVELTHREYNILETLVRMRGAVVSRATLYEIVVDEHDDSMSNLLDVHVCHLRKKLGKDLIKTVRGRGYILE